MERMKFWLLPKAGVEKLAAQYGFEKDTLVARARSMLDSGTTRI